MLIEGQYYRAIADWPKAVEAYRSLFRLFPDSLDYGLLLASAQMSLTPNDSQQTLETLRHLPPPCGDDARIDMMEASAWINTNFTKARAAAQRAIDKANAQGSHVLVARTYGILCQQAPSIGASADAIQQKQNRRLRLRKCWLKGARTAWTASSSLWPQRAHCSPPAMPLLHAYG